MTKHPQKTIYLRFYLTYCICALLIYALLMAFVMPWWHAANHPVRVHIGAGSAQKIALSYADDTAPVQLVPVGESSGYHWHWAAELPPRLRYKISMVFPEGTVGEVVFKQLELIQLKPKRRSSFLKIRDVPIMERPGIQLKKLVDGIRITAEPGAVLDLEIETTDPTAYIWLKTWAKASFGYLICCLVLLFSLASLLQFPDTVQAYRKRTPPWELILTFVFGMLGGAVHMHIINYSMPAFIPGESDVHIEEAIRLHDGLEIMNPEKTDLPRRPGYAVFISLVAGQADWDLHSVITTQGLLFCLGLTLLSLALTRYINAWIIGPILLFAFLSPAAIWANRHIGVESLTTTLWLFGLSAFLYIWQTEKLNKWLGFILFGLVVAFAATLSTAGLLLTLLPVGMLIGALVWAISIRRLHFWKLRVLWRTASQVLVSVAIVITGGLLLEASLPGDWNLLRLSSGRDLGATTAHMFEPQAFPDMAMLTTVVNGRIDSDYSVNWSNFTERSTIQRSWDMLPLQARLALMGRLTYEAFLLPDVELSPGNKLRRDYTVRNSYEQSTQAETVQDSIAVILRETGRAVFLLERPSNRQVDLYNHVVIGIYQWIYTILFPVAIAGWLAGLVDRKYLSGLFLFAFMVNLLWHVYALNPASEQIQSMDTLLLMGALTGLIGTNANSLQKPKDETDRRTLRPIRPKHLLTRHEKMPHIHHGN